MAARANSFENPSVLLNDYVDSYHVYAASETPLIYFFFLSKRIHLNWPLVKINEINKIIIIIKDPRDEEIKTKHFYSFTVSIKLSRHTAGPLR